VASREQQEGARWGNPVSPASFEEAQSELERIVERLERGDVELEELAKLWERGEELYRRCADQLTAAQGKIEELAKRLEGGEAET
jgi:exodeoxyribonuclease VII small subunit